MLASVARKPSMVAMFGRIMPAPLLMPEIDTVVSPICTWRLKALGRVSVVMMPSAARAQCAGCASASAAGRPATMRSTGSGSMITPVENGSTWCAATPSSSASAALVARALARPCAPVPALALPVLITMARTAPPWARCSRLTCTGAAQKRFCVNTPATAAPSSSRNTVRSLRLALRTPASATPIRTPSMASSSAATGAERFTGMRMSFVKKRSNKLCRNANTGRRPCIAAHAGAVHTALETRRVAADSANSTARQRNDVSRVVWAAQASLPWHCLNFRPLPQGQGSLRPTRTMGAPSSAAASSARTVVWLPSSVGEV